MTIAIATNWSASQLFRAGSSIRCRLGTGLQALQYAQTVTMLNRLPDAYLNQAGLRRSDIPEHARRAIYGGESAGRR